jgi:enediyne core biosynthesis thioesterase
MKPYEYHHVVTFDETSFVGNVYFAHYIHWQGRAREMFLRDHAPEILTELEQGLALITLRCSCDFLSELKAFDQVTVCMYLVAITQNRIAMRFEYLREDAPREMVARGEQEIACMRRRGQDLVPDPVPRSLREALLPFMEQKISV